MRQLFAAYRTGDRTAWTEKAIQGAVGVIASVLLANFAMRLFSSSPDRHGVMHPARMEEWDHVARQSGARELRIRERAYFL